MRYSHPRKFVELTVIDPEAKRKEEKKGAKRERKRRVTGREIPLFCYCPRCPSWGPFGQRHMRAQQAAPLPLPRGCRLTDHPMNRGRPPVAPYSSVDESPANRMHNSVIYRQTFRVFGGGVGNRLFAKSGFPMAFSGPFLRSGFPGILFGSFENRVPAFFLPLL
jgi:hypothetical protein